MWKKSFKLWCRYSREAQKPMCKGKESRAFVCGHTISKWNAWKAPLLFSLFFLLTVSRSLHVQLMGLFVYSPFQHPSQVCWRFLLEKWELPNMLLLLLITWKRQPEIVLWSFGCYAMRAECVFVPITESTKILLSESWRIKYCPWKHTSV